MGWKEIDDKLKRRRDALYVSCDEEWELDYLKDLILEEFPEFSEEEVEQALKECCERVSAPRPRTDFLECLQSILGGEW